MYVFWFIEILYFCGEVLMIDSEVYCDLWYIVLRNIDLKCIKMNMNSVVNFLY